MASISSSKNVSAADLKDVEISVPIAYGNVAFWLGEKASNLRSHRWTVYVLGANKEDLSLVIKRVVFQLHSSFDIPTTVVERPPFELSESGWGEFEIVIKLHFHDDVSDTPLDLHHILKLYPEEGTGPMSTKKPVVVELYDEIVLPEPSETLLARAPRLFENLCKKKNPKGNPLNQWFTKFSESDELSQLAAARQQVQTRTAKLRQQIDTIDGKHQQPKSVSDR